MYSRSSHLLCFCNAIYAYIFYTCASICDIEIDALVSTNFALENHQFWRAKTVDVMDCAKTCVKRKLCQSFNFDTDSHLCELNDGLYNHTKTVRHGSSLLYSDIARWPAQVSINIWILQNSFIVSYLTIFLDLKNAL